MESWQINLAFGSSTGLKHDAKIIADIIHAHFPDIRIRKFDGTKHKLINVCLLLEKLFSTWVLQKKQMTFHIEEVYKEVAFHSTFNALFPNQEWLRSGTQAAINETIKVFCKTHYAEEQLKTRWPHCEFTGFTSIDYFSPAVNKDFSMFLHVAGKSEQKGTVPLLKAWDKNPQWPQLFVVSRQPEHASFSNSNIKVISEFLPQEELILLMNKCGIHLCPSEAEGFGHSINEALSTGAAIAVTDAAPMNEFGEDLFLFNVSRKSTRYFSSVNKCSIEDIENTIELIQSTALDRLKDIGRKNRIRYEEQKLAFGRNFIKLLKECVDTSSANLVKLK
mgnify:CR=1 FL=1